MYIMCKKSVVIEGKRIITYGVAREDNKTPIFTDISTDKLRMIGFIEKLNKAEIEPDHLKFYIDDFLCE